VKAAVLGLVRFYQACLSPALPSSCRYYPTCSAYAYEAVDKWGAWRGARMALRRVLRCHPFGGRGWDPVP
jgi:putative membrane protein insertion efficiency factor